MHSIIFSEQIVLHTKFGNVRAKYFKKGRKQGVVLFNLPIEHTELFLRLQSSCLFSESLATQDCDCSQQLLFSIETIQKKGGIVIYVYDEGRGAGLMNKFDSIALQQNHGYDTVEAFSTLGLKKDLRHFKVEIDVLKSLVPVDKFRFNLISNNPLKKAKLEMANIQIGAVIPVILPYNKKVKKYLEEKRDVLGHDIGKL